jgi:hypothetical protein
VPILLSDGACGVKVNGACGVSVNADDHRAAYSALRTVVFATIHVQNGGPDQDIRPLA